MKRLAFVPLVLALFCAAALLLGPQLASHYQRSLLVAVSLVTGVSALVTAFRFSSGDRLLTSWMLLGGAYLISGFRHGARLLSSTVSPSLALPELAGNVLVIAQNLLIALSLLLFVLAWHATGLAMPGSRIAQIGSIVAGIAIAIVVGGYPLAQGLANAGTSSVMVISTFGDMIGIALIVPLALPALAMRGGLLMHTWVYLAASEVAWLLYDIWWALQPKLALGRTGSTTLEAIRIVAIAFAFAASVAQRRALNPLSPMRTEESWSPVSEAAG